MRQIVQFVASLSVYHRLCVASCGHLRYSKHMTHQKPTTFFIKTFGCQQNVADSERVVTYYRARGFVPTDDVERADIVVMNSCMVRDMAEERVYGFIRNIEKARAAAGMAAPHFVLTGCIVGAAAREPSGKLAAKLKKRIPHVELLPIEEVGFEYVPERKKDTKHAWVVISNGCNNYCAFCIVPFSRGREVSRPYADIMREVRDLVAQGYESITLLGQNVNSYGADFLMETRRREGDGATYELPDGRRVDPVWVTHLGRTRIPTLFPYLLEDVARTPGVRKVTFTSSNPWDFSDALIDVIARNENIDRLLHLPVQSGSTKILKKMNRWYTRDEYIALTDKIKERVPGVRFITDIIVGFPGETEEDFAQTVDLARRVGFVKSFTACYSPRPGTAATKGMEDTIPWAEKKRRFHVLNEVINLAHRGATRDQDWVATRERNRVGDR